MEENKQELEEAKIDEEKIVDAAGGKGNREVSGYMENEEETDKGLPEGYSTVCICKPWGP
ncbi:MAG: hypothetical protein J5546_00750 [Lachnospiraceae bacterium]|nr:hypothetical protein [Lachnospiraceae bacterium]